MSYKRATDILPAYLITEIQKYIDGENIYIPRCRGTRKAWGNQTDIRRELSKRNEQIRFDFSAGYSISELSKKYFLSEKSIEGILYQK